MTSPMGFPRGTVTDATPAVSLATDRRGSVLAEYAVTLVAIAVPCAVVTAALGLPLLHLFLLQQACLLLPIP